MATVYLSFMLSSSKSPVAIKVVRQDLADDPEFRRRFRMEVTAARRVQGRYTAPVVDADPDGQPPWLATAYVAGPSLHQAVAEHGPFPLMPVLRLLSGVSEGLAAIHSAGLVHRDLKPSNVLLAADGPRVIDFGVAYAAESTTMTGARGLMGTPAYMSPEQVSGDPVTPATDVFALGNLAFFAATGQPAFGDGHPVALINRISTGQPGLAGCPDELRPIVERCLAKSPGDRPSLAEVADYARARLTQPGDGPGWLPAPVAATLASYDPGRGPAPVPAQPAGAQPAAAQSAAERPVAAGPAGVPGAPSATATSAGLAGAGMAGAAMADAAAGPPAASGTGAGGYGGTGAGSGQALPPLGGAYPDGPATWGPGMGGGMSPLLSDPPARRRRRWPYLAGAAVVFAAGMLVTAVGCQSTTTVVMSPAPKPASAAPPASGTGAAATASATPTDPASSLAAGYTQEYAGTKFTMPGGGCSNYSSGAVVTFTPQGPQVQAGSSSGDVVLNCETVTAGPPEVDFTGPVAAVSGTPDAGGCLEAINREPISGTVKLAQLTAGAQFCLQNSDSQQLVLITLVSKDATTDNLAWTATAWVGPSR